MKREHRAFLETVRVQDCTANVARFPVGLPCIDEVLRGGLVRGGVHEIFPARHADRGAAFGVALTLARKAAGPKPILVARQDVFDMESGEVNGAGLHEIGLDPGRVILVRARHGKDALRAGEQGARCHGLGAVVVALSGPSGISDLTASRRLAVAAVESGVPVLILCAGLSPAPSAAATRWTIAARPSIALEANAPGHPCFHLSLVRQRGGEDNRTWSVAWNREQRTFESRPETENAAHPRAVVSLSRDGPSRPAGTIAKLRQGRLRRAG
ncbi:MAG: hypothetical protein NW216_08640 [Hyphomicrobium sp.]|nr:hypothetical protein [Hyphomicrobium sp.]